MIDGNTAAALGCVYAGATVGAWYPITPSTSLMDAFKGFCERFRKDPKTGEKLYCIVQAEDELAAIGIVLGASWNGARAFTPTSGPGLSLMNEFLGFAYFAELPAVVFDVQRVGPSTGMPTRTQQADILSAAFASHGDTKHVLAVSERSARVLRGRDPGVRPRRAAPDARDRVVRSRHRHERLDVQGARVGSRLSAGSRQGAERRAARRNQGVPSLCRRRRRRNPVPHAARRASEGRVFRARLGSQPVRRSIRKTRSNTSKSSIGSRRSGAPRRSSSRSPSSDARRSLRSGGIVGVGSSRRCDPRGAGPARAERHPRRLLPDTRLPVRRRGGRSSSSSTSGSSSSSRTATRSSRACSRSSSVAIPRVCSRSCNTADCRSTAAASSTTLEQAAARGEAA